MQLWVTKNMLEIAINLANSHDISKQRYWYPWQRFHVALLMKLHWSKNNIVTKSKNNYYQYWQHFHVALLMKFYWLKDNVVTKSYSNFYLYWQHYSRNICWKCIKYFRFKPLPMYHLKTDNYSNSYYQPHH